MKVVLHQIAKREDGDIDLRVSDDGKEPVLYRVRVSEDEAGNAFYCGSDESLFFLLSNAAHNRYGNCAVYQMELISILRAFVHEEGIPALPAELGTTSHCTFKPTLLTIWRNKLWILLFKLGLARPRIDTTKENL